tara:strand:+ start:1037 stop:1312 length:276 start_codon:yes stop_codon:yes gene_type:complete
MAYAQTDVALVDINISSSSVNQIPLDLYTGAEIGIQNMLPAGLSTGDTILASISYNNSLIQRAFQLESVLNSSAVTALSFGTSNRIKIVST